MHRDSAPALRFTTVALPPSAIPARLSDALPRGQRAADVVAWIRRGEGLIGWGTAARFEAKGPTRFEDLAADWADLLAASKTTDDVQRPGTGPIGFVSFAFSDTSDAVSVVVVPHTLIGVRDGIWWQTTVEQLAAPDPTMSPPAAPAETPPSDVIFSDGAISSTSYAESVAAAVERINAGDLDKVVLARDLVATATRPFDAAWIVAGLSESYPTTWAFSVDGLVGATPELLVRREKRLLTSRVLAGTIRRTGDDEHDLALAGSLARSSKDLEEHEYAVRSVAKALEPHCSSMNVPETPSVLHLPNVMHLATDVTGVCANGEGVLELAAALHPSAAVGGTPTATAVALIGELEHMDRRRYAGPVGWVNAHGDGECGIALRCGHIEPEDPRQVRLYAGCGIVAGSDPNDEVAEASAKLVPMRDALSRG